MQFFIELLKEIHSPSGVYLDHTDQKSHHGLDIWISWQSLHEWLFMLVYVCVTMRRTSWTRRKEENSQNEEKYSLTQSWKKWKWFIQMKEERFLFTKSNSKLTFQQIILFYCLILLFNIIYHFFTLNFKDFLFLVLTVNEFHFLLLN